MTVLQLLCVDHPCFFQAPSDTEAATGHGRITESLRHLHDLVRSARQRMIPTGWSMLRNWDGSKRVLTGWKSHFLPRTGHRNQYLTEQGSESYKITRQHTETDSVSYRSISCRPRNRHLQQNTKTYSISNRPWYRNVRHMQQAKIWINIEYILQTPTIHLTPSYSDLQVI